MAEQSREQRAAESSGASTGSGIVPDLSALTPPRVQNLESESTAKNIRGVTPVIYGEVLLKAAQEEDWPRLTSLLNNLTRQRAQHLISRAAVINTLNQLTADTLQSFPEVLIAKGAPLEFFEYYLKAGLAPNTLCAKPHVPTSIMKIFEAAVCAGRNEYISALLDGGFSGHQSTTTGEPVHHFYLRSLGAGVIEKADNLTVLNKFLEKGARPFDLDSASQNTVTVLAESGAWHLAAELIRIRITDSQAAQKSPLNRGELRYYAILGVLCGNEIGIINELNARAEGCSEDNSDPFRHLWETRLYAVIESAHARFDRQVWDATHRLLICMEKAPHLFPKDIREAMFSKRTHSINDQIEVEDSRIASVLGITDQPTFVENSYLLHRWVREGAPAALITKGLELGLDVNVKSFVGYQGKGHVQTAIQFAAERSTPEVVLTLLKKDPILLPADNSKICPLVLFAKRFTPSTETPLVTEVILQFLRLDPQIYTVTGNYNKTSFEVLHEHVPKALDKFLQSKLTLGQTGSDRKYLILDDQKVREVSAADMQKIVLLSGAARYATFLKSLEGHAVDDGNITSANLSYAVMGLHYGGARGVGLGTDIVLTPDDLYNGYLYSLAHTNTRWPPNKFSPLTRLLPHLLFKYPREAVAAIAHNVEYTEQRRLGHDHPYLAELMTLLNHPKDQSPSANSIGYLTAAITSLSPFAKPLSGVQAFNWGRIGALCFSFPFWRAETERIRVIDDGGKISYEPAVIEKFGMQRIQERETDFKHDSENIGKSAHFLGPGYAVTPGSDFAWELSQSVSPRHRKLRFDTDSYVEFRRAYILISNPTDGTLLIRNSSLAFGRDNFYSPAYWSPKGVLSAEELPIASPSSPDDPNFEEIKKGFTVEELQNLTPTMVQSKFSPVTSYKIHDQSKDALFSLLNQLEIVIDAFDKYRFNTDEATAWGTRNGQTVLKGAHKSVGFADVVHNLSLKFDEVELRKERGESVQEPYLAFHNRNFPPWSPYSRLLIGREHIELMRLLARGTIDFSGGAEENDEEQQDQEFEQEDSVPEDLELSQAWIDLNNFFQRGLENRAVLTVMFGTDTGAV